MPSVANVIVHSSQFPEQVRRDLLESLRSRRVNHKFHYDSIKQTQKWLALHQAYSPSRTDADCTAMYDASFVGAVQRVGTPVVEVIGLGCGGGQKDTRLLRQLCEAGKRAIYVASDVSMAMVLVARAEALKIIPDTDCHPLVCDLATAEDLAGVLARQSEAGTSRLFTFFGMIPNFEPHIILPRLAALVRPGDQLLFSANLAPGAGYASGVRQILPLYDNPLTRDWLFTFLLDLGVEPRDGELRFAIGEDPTGSGLQRVEVDFQFTRPFKIQLDGENFQFGASESIRLFFSYRHTPARVQSLLAQYGLTVMEQWVAQSGEEGVFLCRRNAG